MPMYRVVVCMVFVAVLSICASASEVPFVPTPTAVVRAMLSMARVGPTDTVYDLGSGDGRIVIEAAARYRARAVGIELDGTLVRQSRAAARQAGVADRATFIEADILVADFHRATVVTLYLLPDVNLQLRPRILMELRPGTRVVSHDWDMGDWEPDRTHVIEVPEKPLGGTPESLIYLWTVPARVAGSWRGTLTGPAGTEPILLEFQQKFQRASVSAWLPRTSMAGHAHMQGAVGTLALKRSGPLGPDALEFSLQAHGQQIEGTAAAGKDQYLLHATRIVD